MRFYLLIYIFLIPLSRAHAEEVLDQVIKKSGIRGDYLGLWIHGEDRSFSHNGQKQFIPASLSKIPTAGAALEILGLGHKYTTEILADGSISSEGVLDGDLYLKGGGDPGLVSENFWSMVNELKRVGLKKLKVISMLMIFFLMTFVFPAVVKVVEWIVPMMRLSELCHLIGIQLIFLYAQALKRKPCACFFRS